MLLRTILSILRWRLTWVLVMLGITPTWLHRGHWFEDVPGTALCRTCGLESCYWSEVDCY